jgi:hypothetical protein
MIACVALALLGGWCLRSNMATEQPTMDTDSGYTKGKSFSIYTSSAVCTPPARGRPTHPSFNTLRECM